MISTNNLSFITTFNGEKYLVRNYGRFLWSHLCYCTHTRFFVFLAVIMCQEKGNKNIHSIVLECIFFTSPNVVEFETQIYGNRVFFSLHIHEEKNFNFVDATCAGKDCRHKTSKLLVRYETYVETRQIDLVKTGKHIWKQKHEIVLIWACLLL